MSFLLDISFTSYSNDDNGSGTRSTTIKTDKTVKENPDMVELYLANKK